MFGERAVAMIKKCLAVVAVCLLLVMCFPMTALAQDSAPTDSFTHWDMSNGTKKLVAMRDVYQATKTIDIRGLGLTEKVKGTFSDICCDEAGNLYVLTTDSRLFQLDRDYNLIKTITVTDAAGTPVTYDGAKGLLVSDGVIYICDTDGLRILCCNTDGALLREIGRPEGENAELLPADLRFAPLKIGLDSKGYMYVICDGAYYGAMLFDPNGEFTGFYGANTVAATALSTLQYLWDALTMTEEKQQASVKKLPYQFLDLYVDAKDFVYTCTGKTTDSGSTTGQLKKLSPSGTNILYKQQWTGKRVSSSSFNFGESSVMMRQNKRVTQDFVGIQVDERGYIYALDGAFGLIYVYDTDCNLITAFGGGRTSGKQTGVFTNAVAMVYDNGRVMVADGKLNTVTVFERTAYGETLLAAQKKTLDADYTGAKAEWQQVIAQDSNSRLAMRGLAKAYYAEGDYETALTYAQDGFDFVTYGQALGEVQGDFISRNFVWVFLVILAVVAALVAVLIITVKKQVVMIKNPKLRLLFTACIHPFDTFNAVRYKNMGSVPIAAVMTVLFYFSSILVVTGSNFRFTTFDPQTSSSVFQLIQTIGLVLLWTIANWAVSTLQEGKGRLKEIFVVTGYATLPMVVYNVLATILSHVITSPESALLSFLNTFALILTGIILTIGLMVVHEFSFPKFLLSVVLTLFAMILIVFIVFMIGMLISQLWMFIVTVAMEAIYR